VFYSPEDIAAVTALAVDEIAKATSPKELDKTSAKDWQDKLAKTAVRPITLDIALFGRMVTSDAFADVEAAMQVAHAISTNRVAVESDFFTAVDDLISGDNNDDLGAAMMGDIDFNSCCYYIYAAIDTDQLRDNLKYSPDATAIVNEAIPALVQTMAYSNPSGKQNTFAGNVLPETVLVELKDRKIAASYANAFVKAASSSGNTDLVTCSIEKLAGEVRAFVQDFALEVCERLWFCKSTHANPLDGAERTLCASFPELIERLGQALSAAK
jgi:CRISPR system Cascade subunit CasC